MIASEWWTKLSNHLTPQFWSAIAASFSAFGSCVVMFIHRANRRDAARPEIVVSDWSRGDDPNDPIDGADVLRFAHVRNAGKGTAFHLGLFLSRPESQQPVLGFLEPRIAILAPNEEKALDGKIKMIWKNVPEMPFGSPKELNFALRIIAHDSIGFIHETTYYLSAVPPDAQITLLDAIVTGVALRSRMTRISSGRSWRAMLRTPIQKRLAWGNWAEQ